MIWQSEHYRRKKMIEIKMPREMEEVKGDLISRQAVIYYIKPYIQEIITESGVDKNEHTNRMLRAIINGIETMPTGKQQPCEDCISREAVDEYITNLLSGYLYDEERTRLEDLTAFVWELPSVQPYKAEGEDEYKKGYSDGFRDCLDKNV